MKKPAYVVISDLHLDAVTSGVPRFDEVASVLWRAAERARDTGAKFVCLGDVCNPGTARSHRSIAECVAVDEMLSAAGNRRLWLTGNHDVVEDGSGTSVLEPLKAITDENLVVADRPSASYRDGGPTEVCLPFAPLSGDYDPTDFVERIQIIDGYCGEGFLFFGHLNLEGISAGSETTEMPRGRNVFWPVDAIRKRFDTADGGHSIALMVGGHYHTAQRSKDVWIVGAPARFSHGEEGHTPGWLEIDRKLKVERVPVKDARRLITFDASTWNRKGAWNAQKVDGAIVRFRPPADADDVDEKRAVLEASGAAVVRVEAPDAGPALIPESTAAEITGSDGPADAIERRIDATGWPDDDKAALRKVCFDAIGRAGE